MPVPSLGFLTDLDLKALPILADLAIGWLVHSMVLELGGRRRLALAAAAVAVLNPISWFDSVVWGQVDSVGVVFLLLGPARDLARPAGAGGDLRGRRRDHQATARDPDPARGDRHDPARALAGGRGGRPGHGPVGRSGS